MSDEDKAEGSEPPTEEVVNAANETEEEEEVVKEEVVEEPCVEVKVKRSVGDMNGVGVGPPLGVNEQNAVVQPLLTGENTSKISCNPVSFFE